MCELNKNNGQHFSSEAWGNWGIFHQYQTVGTFKSSCTSRGECNLRVSFLSFHSACLVTRWQKRLNTGILHNKMLLGGTKILTYITTVQKKGWQWHFSLSTRTNKTNIEIQCRIPQHQDIHEHWARPHLKEQISWANI